VLLAIQFQAGLPWLVLGMAGLPALATLANWLHYFRVARPALFPRLHWFEWATSRKLWNTGFIFMVLQALALNWYYTDNLVIAQLLGAKAVAGYAVVQRLFSISMVAQFLILPLWPAYGEAIARNDFAWAHRTLNRALLFGVLITGAISLPLLVFAKPIVIFWLHEEFVPSFFLMGGCAILNVLIILAGNLSSLLVHGEMLRKQVVCYAAGSLAALVLKIVLTPRLGVAGVVWGSILGFGILYTPFALRLAYQAVRRPGSGVNPNDERPNVRRNP
jgi:O-antigen/teichoic acid export membrane protein